MNEILFLIVGIILGTAISIPVMGLMAASSKEDGDITKC